MRFDYLDESDQRVTGVAARLLEYPRCVSDLLNGPGVFVFADADDEIIYVGKAASGKLSAEIKATWNTGADLQAQKYRWFRTASEQSATELQAEWIRKYRPPNNVAAAARVYGRRNVRRGRSADWS